MKQKNKLYTVNRWNKPMFMPEENLYPDGGDVWNQLAFKKDPLGYMSAASQGFDPAAIYKKSKNWLGISKEDNPFSKGNLKNAFSKENLGNAAKGAATGLATAAAGIVGSKVAGAISGGLSSEAGDIVGNIGSTALGAAGSVIGGPVGGAIGSMAGQVLGGVTNALFGTSVDSAKLNRVNEDIARLSNFTSNAGSFDEIQGPQAASLDTSAYSGGVFSSAGARRKNRELKKKLIAANQFALRSVDNNINNLVDDQMNDALANYAAYGGPMDFGGGALGLMQQNRYFDTIDKRSEAIAGKEQTMQTGYTGSAKTFADGGLKAAFMDEFGKDPIGAAVRYNQGLEAMAAQEEAKQIEAAREQEYANMQNRLMALETQNQGLQAMMSAMPTTNLPPEVPTSFSSPSRAASSGYIYDVLPQMLKDAGLDIKVTSGYRKAGEAGKAGNKSWHTKHGAVDIVPQGNTTFADIEKVVLTNPEIRDYMLANGYGYLDETNRTKEGRILMAKTGATGNHFHFGKDTNARNNYQRRMNLHAFGGELGTNGTDFTNGLLHIDEGGSHESNPLDGVPMGLDPEGIPNLVEEGETVYDDYVFSDRMTVPDFMLKDLGLPKSKKGISFADASKKLAKESEQRPNDPISQDGLQASLSRLAEIQETERMRKQAEEYMGLEGYACGGKLGRKYSGKGNQSNKLKTYKFDPIESFKYWDKDNGDYDEGYRDFIENKLNEDWITRAMSGQYGDMSRYKGVNNFNPSVEQAWQLGLDYKNSDWHKAMASAYDEYKAGIDPKTGQAPIATQPTVEEETFLSDPYTEGWEERRGISTTPHETQKQEGLEDPKTYATWMRYAPAVGAGIMTLTDALGLTNKPDYGMANKVEAYANAAGVAPQVRYKPVGNYLRYNPMDIWFEQNALNAQSRATDRALMNTTSPSKAAGLIANGYNSQLASGNLYRNALEYNDKKRQDVAEFNRKTNMFNSQMGLEAAMANARYQQGAKQMGLSGLAQAAALRNDIDARVGAARSANLTNFLTSLGNIGRENFAMNQLNWDSSRNYNTDSRGRSSYKRKKNS